MGGLDRRRTQGAAGGAPAIAVFANPIQQRAFKTDVVTQPLGLDPLVAKDLFSLRKKFLVERGLLYELPSGFGLVSGLTHGDHGEGG